MADAQRDRLLLRLREHGTVFGELGRQFGVRMGLHTTDATALVEILSAQDRGAPLTPVELSHHIGLTKGATSALLNRLEAAGHVTRARDSADRRVVTLRATEGVDAMVDRFFDPLIERMGTMMSKYSPEQLAEFERFLDDVNAAMNSHVQEQGQSRT
ncbi:MarR family transcriptional regulator [Actinoplanes sp. Pm04-4]|uniref:MarR family transcriptional regulator n=1 Tax=Paractinoplanes pyxinae TaxID=2997416 RepID=A0ABT4BAV0_9ACTN|nr:MarR family transcriptional regulator [Actinoplanes pyxinae]MCY1143648.1 MarR family transcriptional regulator [Actinoplanes pyxinae]